MSGETYPGWYSFIKENHGKFISALEQLGEAVRQEGPLDDKTSTDPTGRGRGHPLGRLGAQPCPASFKGGGPT